MPDHIADAYNAGGFGLFDNGNSVSGGIGRLWNNLTGATAANQFNASEAEKQRQHELYMSNTAYQRAMSDMNAAGINPATLSGVGGATSPASSSSSSAATGSFGHGGVIGTLVSAVLQLALGKKRLAQDRELATRPRYEQKAIIKHSNGSVIKTKTW